MNAPPLVPTMRKLLPLLLVGGVVLLVGLIMRPFLMALVWAGLVAHVTWPLFSRLQTRLGGRRALSALLMVCGLVIAVGVPVVWLVFLVNAELALAYRAVAVFLDSQPGMATEMAARVPGVGTLVRDWIAAHLANSAALKQLMDQWVRMGASHALNMLSGAGPYLATLAFALLTLFFAYRDGELVAGQIRLILRRTVGRHFEEYLISTGNISRAIVLSVLLAACAQGVLATIGYWVVGVAAPVLLGLITAVASMVPVFGTLLVWGSISIWLLLSGHAWQALGLCAWGTLLIHPADNLLRPLLVSNAANIPFLLAMFGVLGGMSAFGLAGAVLGPIILSVALSMWREWIRTLGAEEDAGGP